MDPPQRPELLVYSPASLGDIADHDTVSFADVT